MRRIVNRAICAGAVAAALIGPGAPPAHAAGSLPDLPGLEPEPDPVVVTGTVPSPELQAELVAQLHAYPSGYVPAWTGEAKVTGISLVDADGSYLYVRFAVRYRELYYGAVLWTVDGSARGKFSLGSVTPTMACVAAPLGTSTALTVTTVDVPAIDTPNEYDAVKHAIVVQFPSNVCVPLYPTLTINDVALAECYQNYKGYLSANTARFTVRLSNLSARTVTVAYGTANGTATAGTDYSAVAGTLTIPSRSPAGTIGVTLRCDSVEEADETFFLNLGNPVNASLADSRGRATIVDFIPEP